METFDSRVIRRSVRFSLRSHSSAFRSHRRLLPRLSARSHVAALRTRREHSLWIRRHCLRQSYSNTTVTPSVQDRNGGLRLNSFMFSFGIIFLMAIQFSIVGYCGFQMHFKMNEMLKNVSETHRRLQFQFFKSLVLQVRSFLISTPFRFFRSPPPPWPFTFRPLPSSHYPS